MLEDLTLDGRRQLGVTVVLVFLGGVFLGYSLTVIPTPSTDRLALTDGVICMAESDTGPHWFVREDGWCYAADNPALKGK
jgi:hypothetical protein